MKRLFGKSEHPPQAKLEKAKQLFKSGQFARAIKKAEKLIRIHQLPQASIIKGLAQLRMRNLLPAKEALAVGIQQLEPFLEQESCDVEKIEIYTRGCLGYGWCLLKQGNIKKCREYLEKAKLFLSFAELGGKKKVPQVQSDSPHQIKVREIRAFNFNPKPSFEDTEPIKEQEFIFDQKLVDEEEFEDLKCPITSQIFREPVVAFDGNTYEKSAIQQWFAKSLTSPLTSEHLESKRVIPNLTLKKVIQREIERAQKKKETKEREQTVKFKSQKQNFTYITRSKKDVDFIHEVQCSECDVFPINGIRYKCTIRQNYNLCSECEADSPSAYPLIKFKAPQKEKKKDRVHSLLDRKIPDFNLGVNPLRPKPSSGPKFSFELINQEPEGDVRTGSGQFFTKSYTLKNNGTMAWPATTTFAYVDGDDFQFKQINMGELAVNATSPFQIWFMAPDRPGLYASFFRLKRTATGEYFGNRIKCSLIVVKMSKSIMPRPKKKEEMKVMESIFLDSGGQEQDNNLENDYRFKNLPIKTQQEALNLWGMGVTKDKNQLLDLVYQHKFNIPQVANDLCSSQT